MSQQTNPDVGLKGSLHEAELFADSLTPDSPEKERLTNAIVELRKQISESVLDDPTVSEGLMVLTAEIKSIRDHMCIGNAILRTILTPGTEVLIYGSEIGTVIGDSSVQYDGCYKLKVELPNGSTIAYWPSDLKRREDLDEEGQRKYDELKRATTTRREFFESLSTPMSLPAFLHDAFKEGDLHDAIEKAAQKILETFPDVSKADLLDSLQRKILVQANKNMTKSIRQTILGIRGLEKDPYSLKNRIARSLAQMVDEARGEVWGELRRGDPK